MVSTYQRAFRSAVVIGPFGLSRAAIGHRGPAPGKLGARDRKPPARVTFAPVGCRRRAVN